MHGLPDVCETMPDRRSERGEEEGSCHRPAEMHSMRHMQRRMQIRCRGGDLMPSILINGAAFDAQPGETVLNVCRRNNIEVPTLCFDETLEPYGACRLCIVEMRQGARTQLVTSCTMPVSDGIEILTDSDRVRKSRKVLLELLLARARCSRDRATRRETRCERNKVQIEH